MYGPLPTPGQFLPALLEARPEFKTNRVEDAAQEFEAMLIGLLLKSAREAGSVFGDEDQMTGGEGYLELAEQELAKTLAGSGIFGFSRLLLQDIKRLEQNHGRQETAKRINSSTVQQLNSPNPQIFRFSADKMTETVVSVRKTL